MGTTPTWNLPYPAATDYVKDGYQNIQDLAEATDTALSDTVALSGLQLVKTQTIGTAVSSVTVTDTFNSSYVNYRIILTGGTASAQTSIRLQLSGITSGYYSSTLYRIFTGTTGGADLANQANAYFGYASATGLSGSMDIRNPNVAGAKSFNGYSVEMATNGSTIFTGGYNASTTQSTDLILSVTTGNMTGGTIYVYGYRNS